MLVRTARVDVVITLLGLVAAADRDITQLDNGTRQKVAVAREVARQPRIILFDEPITNVDTEAKLQLKRAFKELTRRLQQTIIYVTHDQTEAMTLADQIALMQDGRIVQADAPRALYNRPADTFAGWFLGNPGMNFLPATLTVMPSGVTELHSRLFAAPVTIGGANLTYSAIPADEISLGIRPEHVQVSTDPLPLSVEGHLHRKAISIGRQYLLTLEVAGQTIKAKVAPEQGARLDPGDTLQVALPLDRITLFTGTGRRLDATLSVSSSAAPARVAPLSQ
jgi:ABC-type sugar transport system ATPase subunit